VPLIVSTTRVAFRCPQSLRSGIFEERKVLHMQRPRMRDRNLQGACAAALAALGLAVLLSAALSATVPKAPPPAAALGARRPGPAALPRHPGRQPPPDACLQIRRITTADAAPYRQIVDVLLAEHEKSSPPQPRDADTARKLTVTWGLYCQVYRLARSATTLADHGMDQEGHGFPPAMTAILGYLARDITRQRPAGRAGTLPPSPAKIYIAMRLLAVCIVTRWLENGR
jgi:hypothetical protein